MLSEMIQMGLRSVKCIENKQILFERNIYKINLLHDHNFILNILPIYQKYLMCSKRVEQALTFKAYQGCSRWVKEAKNG